MIDQNGHARLADFGLLTFVSDPTNPSSVTIAGTPRWMSPELLYPEKFGFEKSRPTEKSDCYALGMLILEVLSERCPFPSHQNYIVMRKVIEGERPERPEGVWFTDDLWRTLEQCWLPQPENRPTIEAVLECLGEVSKIWQPLPPLGESVETDGDKSVSLISQCTFLHFVPRPLPKIKTVTLDSVVSDSSTSDVHVRIGTPHEPHHPWPSNYGTSTGEPAGTPEEPVENTWEKTGSTSKVIQSNSTITPTDMRNLTETRNPTIPRPNTPENRGGTSLPMQTTPTIGNNSPGNLIQTVQKPTHQTRNEPELSSSSPSTRSGSSGEKDIKNDKEIIRRLKQRCADADPSKLYSDFVKIKDG